MNDVMEGDKVMMGDPPSPLPHQENLGYFRVDLVVATRLVGHLLNKNMTYVLLLTIVIQNGDQTWEW